MIVNNQVNTAPRDFYSSKYNTKYHLEKNDNELVLSRYDKTGNLIPVKYKRYDNIPNAVSITRLNGNKNDFFRISIDNDSYENVSKFSKITKHDSYVDVFISEFNFLLKGKEKISVDKDGKTEKKLVEIEKFSFKFFNGKKLGPLAQRYLKKIAEFMSK